MNKREKILLAIVVGILLIFSGESLITESFLQPLRDREGQVADLEQRIHANDRAFQQIQVAQKQLAGLTARSLPADPSVASTLYQNWLLKIAALSELKQIIVTPHRMVAEGDAFVRFPFSIQATTRLENLCEFMHAFYQAELLQKITQVSIETTDHSNDPTLQITVHLESVVLNKAERRSTLFPVSDDLDKTEQNEVKPRPNFDALLQHNFFVRGYGGSSQEATMNLVQKNPNPKPKPIDFGAQTYLIGSLFTDGKPEAWIFDRKRQHRTILFEGSAFEVAEIAGTVSTIDDDSVMLEIQGVTKRLDLGRNFRQLVTVERNWAPDGP